MKSTPVELGLLAAALVGLVVATVGVYRGRRPVNLYTFALAVGCGLLFLTCSISSKQFGVRYVLPLYPAVIILGVSALAEWLASRRTVLAVGLAALVAGQAYASISIAPRQLSYFNSLFGGPGRGSEFLGNSDVDWGQGLRDLKEFLDAHDEPGVVVLMHAARPEGYGIAVVPWGAEPPCRYIAIGWTQLRNTTDNAHLEPFRRLRPSAVIGYSVCVYDLHDPATQEALRASLQEEHRPKR